MARFFHVTSSRNRSSIQKYGLDWKRMDAVGNVAGGSLPEQEGIFVCEDYGEVEYFSRMNGTGGPLGPPWFSTRRVRVKARPPRRPAAVLRRENDYANDYARERAAA